MVKGPSAADGTSPSRPLQLGCTWSQQQPGMEGQKSRSTFTDEALAKVGVVLRGASLAALWGDAPERSNADRHVSPPAALLSEGTEELLRALQSLSASSTTGGAVDNNSKLRWLSGKALIWVSSSTCATATAEEPRGGLSASPSVSPERDQEGHVGNKGEWYSLKAVSVPTLSLSTSREGNTSIPFYSEGPTATLAIGRDSATCNLTLNPSSTEQQAVVSRRHCELDVRVVEYTFDAVLKSLSDDNEGRADGRNDYAYRQDTQITSVARKAMLKATLRLRCCKTVARDCGTINGTLLWGYKLPKGGQSGEIISVNEEPIGWSNNNTAHLPAKQQRLSVASLSRSLVSEVLGGSIAHKPTGPSEQQVCQLTSAPSSNDNDAPAPATPSAFLCTNAASNHANVCLQLGAGSSFKGGERVMPTKNVHVTLHLTAQLGGNGSSLHSTKLPAKGYSMVVLGHMAPYSSASDAAEGILLHRNNDDKVAPPPSAAPFTNPSALPVSMSEVSALAPRITTPAIPQLMDDVAVDVLSMEGWKVARPRGGQSPPSGRASPGRSTNAIPPAIQHQPTLSPEKGVQHLYRNANDVLQGILAAGVAEGTIAAGGSSVHMLESGSKQRLTLGGSSSVQQQNFPSPPQLSVLSPTSSAPNQNLLSPIQANTFTNISPTARAVQVADELYARQQATKEVFENYRKMEQQQQTNPAAPNIALSSDNVPGGPRVVRESYLAGDSHHPMASTNQQFRGPSGNHLPNRMSGNVPPPSGTLYAFSSVMEGSPIAVSGSAPAPLADESNSKVVATASDHNAVLALASPKPSNNKQPDDSAASVDIIAGTYPATDGSIVAATAMTDHHSRRVQEPTNQSYLGFQSGDKAISLGNDTTANGHVAQQQFTNAPASDAPLMRNLFEPVERPKNNEQPLVVEEEEDLSAFAEVYGNKDNKNEGSVGATTPARRQEEASPAANTPSAIAAPTEKVEGDMMGEDDDAPVVLIKGGRQRTVASGSASVAAATSPMAGKVQPQAAPVGPSTATPSAPAVGIALPTTAFVRMTKVEVPDLPTRAQQNLAKTPESLSPAQPHSPATINSHTTRRSFEEPADPNYLEHTLRGSGAMSTDVAGLPSTLNPPPIAAETQKHFDDIHAMLEVHLSQERYGPNHDIAPREVLPALSRASTQVKTAPAPPPKLTAAQRKEAKKKQLMQANAMRVADFVAELRSSDDKKKKADEEAAQKPHRKLLRPEAGGNGGFTQFENAKNAPRVDYGGYNSLHSDDDEDIGTVLDAQKNKSGAKTQLSSQQRLAAELKAQLDFMGKDEGERKDKRRGKGFAGEDDDASSASDENEENFSQLKEDVRIVRIGSGPLIRPSGGSGVMRSQVVHEPNIGEQPLEDVGGGEEEELFFNPEELIAAPSQTQQRLFRGASKVTGSRGSHLDEQKPLLAEDGAHTEPPPEGLEGRSTVYIIDTRRPTNHPKTPARTFRETLADTPFSMTGDDESQQPGGSRYGHPLHRNVSLPMLSSQRSSGVISTTRLPVPSTLDLAGSHLIAMDSQRGIGDTNVKAALSRLHDLQRSTTILTGRRPVNLSASRSPQTNLLARPTEILGKKDAGQLQTSEGHTKLHHGDHQWDDALQSQQQSLVLVASQFYDTPYVTANHAAKHIASKRSRSPADGDVDEDPRYSQPYEEAAQQSQPTAQPPANKYLSCLAALSQEQSGPVPVEELESAEKRSAVSPPPAPITGNPSRPTTSSTSMHVPKRTKATKASERHQRCMNAIHAALAIYAANTTNKEDGEADEGVADADDESVKKGLAVLAPSSVGGHLSNKHAVFESEWQAVQASEEEALIREAAQERKSRPLCYEEEDQTDSISVIGYTSVEGSSTPTAVLQRTINADAHNRYLCEYPPLTKSASTKAADPTVLPTSYAITGRIALPDSQAPDAFEKGIVAAANATIGRTPLPNTEALVLPQHLYDVLHVHQRDAIRYLWSRLMHRSFAGWFGENAMADDERMDRDAITTGLLLLTGNGGRGSKALAHFTPLTPGTVVARGVYALVELSLAPAAQKHALLAQIAASPKAVKQRPSPSAALMAAIQTKRREGIALKKAAKANDRKDKSKAFKFSFEDSDGSLASDHADSDGSQASAGPDDSYDRESQLVDHGDDLHSTPRLSPNQEIVLSRACAISQLIWMLALNQCFDLSSLSLPTSNNTPSVAPSPIPDVPRSVILAHSMGLGKTLSSIAFLATLWRFAEIQRPSVTMAIQALLLDTLLPAHSAYEDYSARKLQLEAEKKKNQDAKKERAKTEGSRRISFGGGGGGERQGTDTQEETKIFDPAPAPRQSDADFSELLRQLTALPACISFSAAVKEGATPKEAPILTFASVRTVLVVPKSVTFHWIKEFSRWAPYTSTPDDEFKENEHYGAEGEEGVPPPPVSIFYLSGDKQHANKSKHNAKTKSAGIDFEAPPPTPKSTSLKINNPFPEDHRATLVSDWANSTGRSVLLLTHAMLVALMKEDSPDPATTKAASTRKKAGGRRAANDSDEESSGQESGSDDDFWNDYEAAAGGAKGKAKALGAKATKRTKKGKDEEKAEVVKQKSEWDEFEEEFIDPNGKSVEGTASTDVKTTVGAKRSRTGAKDTKSAAGNSATSSAAIQAAPNATPISVRAFCRSTIALRANVVVVDEAHKVQTSPNLLAALNAVDAIRSRKVQEALNSATGRAIVRNPYAAAIVASVSAGSEQETTAKDLPKGRASRVSTTYHFDSDEETGDTKTGVLPWGEGRVPPSPLALFEFFGSLTPPLLKIALTGTPLGVSPSSSSVTAPGPKGELLSILPWADKTTARHISELSKEFALRQITQVRSLRVVSHLLPPLYHATVLVKHSDAQVAMLKELILSEQERGAIQPKHMLELVTRFLWIGNHCDLVAHWARSKGAVGPDGKILPDAQRRMKFRGRASVEWAIPSLDLPSPLMAQLDHNASGGSDKTAVVRATVESLQHSPKMLVLMHLLHQSLMANPPTPNPSYDGTPMQNPMEYPEKVAVFSHSVRTLFIMGIVLANCSDLQDGVDFAVMSGSMPSATRDELIGRFNDPTDPMRILFLSHRSFDTGTTLTGGCRVILYDVSHRLHDDAQAVFRVFRVGQRHPKVNVVQLVMDNRIEQRLCGVSVVIEQRKQAVEAACKQLTSNMANTTATGRSKNITSGGVTSGKQSKDLLDEEHLDFGKALSAQALLNSIVPVDKPNSPQPTTAKARATVVASTGADLGAEGLALYWNVVQPLQEFASCDPLLQEALYPQSKLSTQGDETSEKSGGCVPYISHVVAEQLM